MEKNMKKTYKNFLTEYKGYDNQNFDIFSEEFNLNLKGGEISLFPNFLKNNTDNDSFLRQTGNELFLPLDTTMNTNNKDSSEEKYFISTENDLKEESIKKKNISDESKTENMSEKETTQESTEENESSTENLSSTSISLENQKGGNKLKFTETSDSINFPSEIEIESIVQDGGNLEVSDSINFPSEIEIESIVQDGGNLEVSDSIKFPSEVENVVHDGGNLEVLDSINFSSEIENIVQIGRAHV